MPISRLPTRCLSASAPKDASGACGSAVARRDAPRAEGIGSVSDLAETLSTERLRLTLAVRDWLVGEARDIADPNVIIEGLSLKLRDAGVPIDRAVSAVEFRHAERAANARIWVGVGIALHFGHAAFGNVGSGARLDYTVIGPDVNLAARIADLCGELDEGLLLSDAFQSRLSEQELRKLGSFPLKGVAAAPTVVAPVGP